MKKPNSFSDEQSIGVIPIPIPLDEHLQDTLKIYAEEVGLANAAAEPDNPIRLEIRPMEGIDDKLKYYVLVLAGNNDVFESSKRPKQDPALALDTDQLKSVIDAINSQMASIKGDIRIYSGDSLNLKSMPDKFEECTSFQKLVLLTYALATVQPGGINRLGQRYALGEGMKSPAEIFKTSSGDCDELAVMLYGISQHLRLAEAGQLTLTTIDDKNEPEKRIGHANIIYSTDDGTYVLDLTHRPPISEIYFKVDRTNLVHNEKLENWELNNAVSGQPEDKKIQNPIFTYFSSIGQYYHYQRGFAYYKKKRWKRAEKELLVSDQNRYAVRITLADAQMNQGVERYPDSAKNFIACAQIKPEDKEVQDMVEINLSFFIAKTYPIVQSDLNNTIDDLHLGRIVSTEEHRARSMHYSNLLMLSELTRNFMMENGRDYHRVVVLAAKGKIAYSYELALNGQFDKINENDIDASLSMIENTKENEIFTYMSSEVKRLRSIQPEK